MLTNCRLCLAKDANFLITNGRAAMRILSCTGIEVNANDKLPQMICQACRLRLEEFHFFRRRCHAADQRLRYLKRQSHRNDVQSTGGDDEEELLLRDVSQCSVTACSESSALWRREAAQMIRKEIDEYKKQLLDVCKQQVREEIELQVRKEMEQLLLTQAQKNCRLTVLDDLFYEIESFFVQKRNETVRDIAYGSEGFGSDFETTELGSLSTIACPTECNVDLPSTINHPDVDANDVTILEVLDDEPAEQTPAAVTVSAESSASSPEIVAMPVPMVEINMDHEQHSHLRDDLMTSHFLSPKPGPSAKANEPQHLQKEVRNKIRRLDSPYDLRMQLVCQQHKSHQKNPKKGGIKALHRGCYRCRLRGSQNQNKHSNSHFKCT